MLVLDCLMPPDVSVLGTDVFHERIKVSTAFQEKLARARRADDAAAVRAVQAELGDLHDVEDVLVRLIDERGPSRQAREGTGASPPWLAGLEQELARAARTAPA